MKKTTSSKLTKQLSAYGAMTAALAGITDANGQIVYKDFFSVTGGKSDNFLIDLNTDGINDFRLDHNGKFYSSAAMYLKPLNANNEVLGDSQARAYALSAGNPISSAVTSWKYSGAPSRAIAGITEPLLTYSSFRGNFNNVDAYIGVRFDISGSIHYGWIRVIIDDDMQPDSFSTSWTVVEGAYNTTPGAAINAGQQTLGIEDNLSNTIRIASLNKTISLHNLPGSTSYQLYSMTGQSLLEGSIEGSTYAIEAGGLASGVYILQLNDLDTNATLRKKVVL
ncbi:T9SS type A sorting domain-containing protein [Leptobacterium sp. I13]|uniref:T9SS type A sorting domain-containing protein n=1 Tax=Leptobacterium meishanense TaxID=3128904 RepID=UPI0030EC4E10